MWSIVFLLACQGAVAQSDSAPSAHELVEPFQVFDNLYYVGIFRVSAHLLSTSEGLILIDTTFDEDADTVLENIRKVGFDPKDIKYILVTHAHGDHVGGARRIQEATGATVGMARKDWELLESRERSGSPIPKRDWVVKEGDTLTLGDTTLKFYVTPGHTPGVLSMTYTVYDQGKPYKALTFGGPGLNFRGVENAELFLDSVKRLLALKNMQVSIPPHAKLNDGFAKARALAKRKPGDPHPFVTPGELKSWLESLGEQAQGKLDLEKNPDAYFKPRGDFMAAKASSTVGGNLPVGVIDGNYATRWSSQHKEDPQWIAVEMKKAREIHAITIRWESASASEYEVLISMDGQSWNSVATIRDGLQGEKRTLAFTPSKAKFIKVLGTKRAVPTFGYSIFEISVE